MVSAFLPDNNSHSNGVEEITMLLKQLRPVAQLAVAAYANTLAFGTPRIPRVITSEQLLIWTPAAFNNTQVHVALVEEFDNDYKKEGKTVAAVFAFRGTQPWSVSDWLIDFEYYPEEVDWWPAKSPAPKAHGGFLGGFNSVAVRPWPDKAEGSTTPHYASNDRAVTLDAALQRQIAFYTQLTKKPLKPEQLTRIISTGHSLGAAMATLGAVWARVALPKYIPATADLHVTCVTLGSPLLGDQRFADLFIALPNFACYRIVHGMDPVPLVPPLPGGAPPPPPQNSLFKHVGRPIWLQKNMVAYSRWYKVFDSGIDVRPLHESFFVLDHFEWRYLVAFDMAIANTVMGTRPAEEDAAGSSTDQLLVFLDDTFGILNGIKGLSIGIKSTVDGFHDFVSNVSPFGGKVLAKVGGKLYRASLAPLEVVVYIGTQFVAALDG